MKVNNQKLENNSLDDLQAQYRIREISFGQIKKCSQNQIQLQNPVDFSIAMKNLKVDIIEVASQNSFVESQNKNNHRFSIQKLIETLRFVTSQINHIKQDYSLIKDMINNFFTVIDWKKINQNCLKDNNTKNLEYQEVQKNAFLQKNVTIHKNKIQIGRLQNRLNQLSEDVRRKQQQIKLLKQQLYSTKAYYIQKIQILQRRRSLSKQNLDSPLRKPNDQILKSGSKEASLQKDEDISKPCNFSRLTKIKKIDDQAFNPPIRKKSSERSSPFKFHDSIKNVTSSPRKKEYRQILTRQKISPQFYNKRMKLVNQKNRVLSNEKQQIFSRQSSLQNIKTRIDDLKGKLKRESLFNKTPSARSQKIK